MSYNSVKQYTCSEVFVNFKSVLGSGSFGTVYKGKLNGGDVAVKVINGNNYESVREVKRMLKVSGHDNVLSLLGAVDKDNHYNDTCHKRFRDTTWLVMEYMDGGNLKDYIAEYSGGIPAYGMIKIAYQVALGMDYLHRFCNMLHMDLAARNVLVHGKNFLVKIGDFGLCRDYDYQEHYHNNNGVICPTRWMPPENLPSNRSPKFSRKGDVWSFGVLLFELWSRGHLPFAGMSDNEVIHAVVHRGQTVLDFHSLCARQWVIDLMRQCFAYSKDDRPNFRRIFTTIKDDSEFELNSDKEDDDEDDASSYESSYY